MLRRIRLATNLYIDLNLVKQVTGIIIDILYSSDIFFCALVMPLVFGRGKQVKEKGPLVFRTVFNFCQLTDV